ncbi:MAG: ABC transporter permease [Candidatus Omnitrophota bacterium]|jgi:phospholipid/cholesterol/gamma-HCH transport system permease protein
MGDLNGFQEKLGAQYSMVRSWVSLRRWLATLGHYWITFCYQAGGISYLFIDTLIAIRKTSIRWGETVSQVYKIGVTSFMLVFFTSIFTGMVLALQAAYQLRLFAAEQFTAHLVSLSVTRELGPVLTAMVVAGRVGASIAAELGTMKVTEQIDALKSMGVNPVRYLVVPRFLAAVLALFILAIYADVVGCLGGYMIAVFKLGISPHLYIKRTLQILMIKDVMTGLIKALFFGGVIATVGCYYGFNAEGGAEGVGKATTMAVVTALIMIIASDAFFTAIFYFF